MTDLAKLDTEGVERVLAVVAHPDDMEYGAAIARRIREVRPQMAISLTWELDVGFGINHVDHRACGMALMDAIRDADNPWIFQDLGLKRWKVERALFCA
ncbi:GlcNAc-PI de-N-acetylase, partial [Brevibacterium paucivorans]